MKGFLYLFSNQRIQFEAKLFFKKGSFEYINLPLKGFKKYFYFFFNIFYPILGLNHNQIYLLLNFFLRKKNKLISYSFFSERIQDLSLKFKFIKIIQIQNGVLNPDSQKSLNLKHIDIILTISEFQSENALKHFAKKAFVVGSLSTENWIKNIKIANKISGFKYDICFICNTKFKDDVRYALDLAMVYVLGNFKHNLFLAIKSKTDLKEIAEFCYLNYEIDIYNHEQISFPNNFT